MKKILATTAIIVYSLLTFGQHRTLKTIFENSTPYDSLVCRMTPENNNSTSVSGIYHTSNNSWTFNIPDSTFERYKLINFLGYFKKPTEITYAHPSFRIINRNDSTYFMTGYLYWEDADTLLLHANYVKQDTIRNSNYYGTGNVVISQEFNLIDPSPELQRTLVNANNIEVTNRERPSNQFENIFIEMISEAPDSRSCMTNLYERKNWFTPDQIKSMYALFSKKRQQSYFGQKLNEYIRLFTDKFEDTELTNCSTAGKEPIVIDENKYTLLVFSASWCGPCHELIPALKELYDKKKDVLNIVYVTLDEQKQLPAWQKLMKEKDIPWRSLSTDGKINEIREKYKIPSIPYSYLIHPQKMKAEKIEIRSNEDKVKIEEL